MKIITSRKFYKKPPTYLYIFIPMILNLSRSEGYRIYNQLVPFKEVIETELSKIKTTTRLDVKLSYSLIKRLLPEDYSTKLDEIYEKSKKEGKPNKFIVYKTPNVTISPLSNSNFKNITELLDGKPDTNNSVSLYIASISLLSYYLHKTFLGSECIEVNENSTGQKILHDISSYILEEGIIDKEQKTQIDAGTDYAHKIEKRLTYS